MPLALALDPVTALPFSRDEGPGAVARAAQELTATLGLKAEIRLLEGNGVAGLVRERAFRLRWWTSGDEPLRTALHRMETRVYRKAREPRVRERVITVWRETERVVHGDAWRDPLRSLVHALDPEESAFIRLTWRVAQQAASRAVRWQAVLDEPSPFVPLTEMLALGAWPLGVLSGVLQVFVWKLEAPSPSEPIPPAEIPVPQEPGGVLFLSARFRDGAQTARWEEALRRRGWDVVHGPVNEESAPPEAQLGAQIRRVSAVLGLLPEYDSDFGLPWWMFQELDYARACGRPVALAGPDLPDNFGVPGLRTFEDRDPKIWRWLHTIARKGGE